MNTEPRYELNIDLGSIKKGTKTTDYSDDSRIYFDAQDDTNTYLRISRTAIPKALADGIIRKVEEPKWTHSDMIRNMQEYALYCEVQGKKYHVKTPEEFLKSKEEGK